MQYILAAILVVAGAGPLSDWLLASPYSQFIRDFLESTAIQSMLGHPDWLLTGAFLMACYGAAGILLCAGNALVSSNRYVCSDVSPFQASRHSLSSSPAKTSHPVPK